MEAGKNLSDNIQDFLIGIHQLGVHIGKSADKVRPRLQGLVKFIDKVNFQEVRDVILEPASHSECVIRGAIALIRFLRSTPKHLTDAECRLLRAICESILESTSRAPAEIWVKAKHDFLSGGNEIERLEGLLSIVFESIENKRLNTHDVEAIEQVARRLLIIFGKPLTLLEPVENSPVLCEETTRKVSVSGRNQIFVDVLKQKVVLDGVDYEVDSKQAVLWVAVLVSQLGQWVSSSDLPGHDTELDGARTDRLKKSLPAVLQDAIESKSGTGSRLKLA